MRQALSEAPAVSSVKETLDLAPLQGLTAGPVNEEASIAFQLMMEIRNGLMEAYQEVMRAQA